MTKPLPTMEELVGLMLHGGVLMTVADQRARYALDFGDHLGQLGRPRSFDTKLQFDSVKN